MEKVIFPDPSGQTWLLESVGDPETFDLFGTTVVPTPFMASLPAETVLAELESIPANAGDTFDYFDTYEAWAEDCADAVRRGHGAAVRMARIR